jgi:SNARE protein
MWDQKARRHDEDIKRIVLALQWHKEGADRTDLLGGRSTDHMSAGELVKEGLAIQEDSKNRTSGMIKMTEKTIAQGTETANTLKAQTEQLSRINDGVDQVEGNLKRAERELRMFIRRMATDKIILGMLVLLVLGVVAMIAYKIAKPKSKEVKDWWNVGKPSFTPSVTTKPAW